MKVYNRSDSVVSYSLPELRVRRVFNLGECKELEPAEMEALWQTDGGQILIKQHLCVDDKEWVSAHWDAPIEYFWKDEDIKICLTEDSIDLFRETLEYAPEGVIDLIKNYAWRLPIHDLNKIEAIKEATGFDVLAAIDVMSAPTSRSSAPAKKERLRKREG